MILLHRNILGFEGDLSITTSPLSYFENFVVMCSEIIMSSEYIVGSMEGPEHCNIQKRNVIADTELGFSQATAVNGNITSLTITISAICSTKQWAIQPYCKIQKPTPKPLARYLRIIF